MVSEKTSKLFDNIRGGTSDDIFSVSEGRPVSVNTLTHNVGALYEKVRYAVDYKEEHVVRRNAITRMIKRSLGNDNLSSIGSLLLQDLVSARYLPNNEVSEDSSKFIQAIIERYLGIIRAVGYPKVTAIELAAAEIEYLLTPQPIDLPIAQMFWSVAKEKIVLPDSVKEEDTDRLLFLACYKCLLDEDVDGLRYALLTWKHPYVKTVKAEDLSLEQIKEIEVTLDFAEKARKNSLVNRIINRLKNESIYFSLLREFFTQYGLGGEAVINNREAFEAKIREMLQNVYVKRSSLINRSGGRAVLYILITKVCIALLLEAPYEYLRYHGIDRFALGVNILFHPLLLFLMIKTVRRPDQHNTDFVVSNVMNIVYGDTSTQKKAYIADLKGNFVLNTIFALIYFIFYIAIFGAMIYVLRKLNFHYESIALFAGFLALVSFFGIRIRYKASKWIADTGRKSLFQVLFDYLSLPIVRMGKFLNEQFSSVNVFVFLLDFIIENPFKYMLTNFDKLAHFLREKQEDLM